MRKPHVLLMIESSRGYGRGRLAAWPATCEPPEAGVPIPVERGLLDDMPACLRGLALTACSPASSAKAGRANPGHGRARGGLGRGGAAGHGRFRHRPGGHRAHGRRSPPDRGFRHVAYCGFPGVQYSDRRCAAFLAYLESKGLRNSVYEPPLGRRHAPDAITEELRGSLQVEHIANWLASLPRLLGLMACNDARGRQVLEPRHLHDLVKVPQKKSPWSASTMMKSFGDLSVPPLSSVDPDTLRIGFEGA